MFPTLQINLTNLQANYYSLKKQTNSLVAAVVKANAYGLGMVPVATALSKAGCTNFFVTNIQEALELVNSLPLAANIYVLHGVAPQDLETAIMHQIIPVVNNYSQWQNIQNYAQQNNKQINCALHLDTGMNRLGLQAYELQQILDSNYQQYVTIKLIMSHLVASEEQQNSLNLQQRQLFEQLTAGLANIPRSIANSGGVFLGTDYHFDLVRPGAALYGLHLGIQTAKQLLQEVVTLHAPIISMHDIVKGQTVGYNATYTCLKPRGKIATIPIGYADGISRLLSNNYQLYIQNIPVPIIGYVSMDLLTIDVTDVPAELLYLGQQVEVIGQYSKIADIATICRTSGYEVLTNLGNRFQRVYA